MKFEWDEAKNETNIAKHGFDFAEAWEVFELPVLVAADRRVAYGEDRFLGIGFLRLRVVVIVFAQVDDDTIRVVSLRKALGHERKRFEEFLKNQLGTN